MEDAETACARLIARYTLALDAGDADAVASLFTEDGVWHRQGKDLAGHDAIKAAIKSREAGVVIRHHVSSVDVTLEGPDKATGRSYYALYRAEPSAGERPYPVDGPERCGDNLYSFRRVNGTWRLSRTEARPTFRRK